MVQFCRITKAVLLDFQPANSKLLLTVASWSRMRHSGGAARDSQWQCSGTVAESFGSIFYSMEREISYAPFVPSFLPSIQTPRRRKLIIHARATSHLELRRLINFQDSWSSEPSRCCCHELVPFSGSKELKVKGIKTSGLWLDTTLVPSFLPSFLPPSSNN